MIASFIVAAVIGQYGGHCSHLATGYCATCAPHYAGYHAPAAFAADPNYYAGVVAAAIRKQAADEAAARAARDNAAKLDARLARIEAALSRPVAAPPASATIPAPVQPAAASAPAPPDPSAVAAAPLETALQRCAGCHSDSSPSGKLALFDDDGRLRTLDLWTRVKVHERVKPDAPKRMPPKGEPLSPAERGIVAESIKSDLAAIAATLKD